MVNVGVCRCEVVDVCGGVELSEGFRGAGPLVVFWYLTIEGAGCPSFILVSLRC